MKLVFPVAVLFIFSACKPAFNAVFHVNRKFTFTNREDYLQYLGKKTSLAPRQVMYLDSTSEQSFFIAMMKGEFSEYYGSFINDSVEIRKSAFLEENTTCIGRVLKEIETNSGAISDSLLIINKTIKHYKLFNAKTGQPLNLNSDKKVKVFLLYSYRFGTYFNSLYRDVAAVSKNKSDYV